MSEMYYSGEYYCDLRGQSYQYKGGVCEGCSTILTDGMHPKQPPERELDTTNPKDLLGVKKVRLGLLPAATRIYGALAMENGAFKYGPFNWRDKKIRLTIYLDAIERHLLAYRD